MFFGNQTAYDIAECIVTFSAGASIPISSATKAGKVLTTVDKVKLIGIEIFKEAAGTAGDFGGVWLGQKLGLSQNQSIFLGMITRIVSSKGADWVDNNFDNLLFAGKYTFNNYGKNVTLSMNGTGTINTFFDTFTDIKNGKIVFNSIDDVIKIGITSVDDLMKLGVNSVDDLAKLKVSSIDDLAKIGIKNADDLAKLGIDSSDLKKIGIDSKVFDDISNTTGRLIPGNPGVVIGGDSTKLGKNIMESMGLKRSTKWTGHQAQHIIPAEMADNLIIQKIGMDLDNATNGILLRTPDAELSAMSRHRGYHSVYNDVVRNELNRLDINQSVDVLQKQVFELQSDLRKLQENGLPLYPGQGATVDLWERSLDRIRN